MTITENRRGTEELLSRCQGELKLGRAGKALELAQSALAAAPGSVAAHLWRGLALKDLARLEEAHGAFEQALRIEPACMPALVNRAAILRRLGRCEDALLACDAALALDPGFAAAHCNRGLVLLDLDQPREALEDFDRALALAPNFAAAHGNRGKALHTLGRFEEALDAYRQVMALEPNSAQVYLNASHSSLVLGHFEQGFNWYEWRKRMPEASPPPHPALPLWLGAEDIAGKTLLLHGEQGLGDCIQFSRYARLVRQRGAKVVLVVPERLVRLLRSLGQDIEVRGAAGVSTSGFDYHCPLPSLPLAFRTRLHSIPAAPYLSAEPERVARWRAAIGRRGFKIGITWQGNPSSPADRGRSPPLELFETIATLPGVRLISLQRGAGIEQISGARERFALETMPANFDQGSNAFVDSAALMQSLDLVISSDTAAAHLAGALGRPTWLVLQHVADWRWLTGRKDCPWYPSMRLFRQSERGQWRGVFEAMRSALAAVLETP